MWMERYFQKLPKSAHLVPVRLRPPSPKRPKRGPGRPRKVQTPPAPAPLVLDDSDRSTSDSSSNSDDSSDDEDHSGVTTERQVRPMKRLYHPKQKRTVVSYAKAHSVTAATKHFSIPRTTINRWMVDGYFNRKVSKKGVKKGGGRPITYSSEIEEKILTWVLENRDLQLPITIPLLRAKGLELLKEDHPNFKASSGWAQKFMKRHSLVLRAKTSMAQELPVTLEERIVAFNPSNASGHFSGLRVAHAHCGGPL